MCGTDTEMRSNFCIHPYSSISRSYESAQVILREDAPSLEALSHLTVEQLEDAGWKVT